MQYELDPKVAELAQAELKKLIAQGTMKDSHLGEVVVLVADFVQQPKLSWWQQVQIKLGLTTYDTIIRNHVEMLHASLESYHPAVRKAVTETVVAIQEKYVEECD